MLLPVDSLKPVLCGFRNHVLMPGHKRMSELSCTVLSAALWVMTFKLVDLGYCILFGRWVGEWNHPHWLIQWWEGVSANAMQLPLRSASLWSGSQVRGEHRSLRMGCCPEGRTAFSERSLLQTSVKMLKAWSTFTMELYKAYCRAGFLHIFSPNCISKLLFVFRWDELVTYET